MVSFVRHRYPLVSFVRHLLVLLVLLLGGVACSKPAVPDLRVQAIGAMDRFAPFEAVTGQDRVTIFAARNEYEGFQFVITAGERSLRNVQVAVSQLKHSTGVTLPQPNVFRERYVRVSTPSPYSPYAPQLWPDILLPALDNTTVADAYRAFPQNLSAKENLPVWVDTFVPMDALPGQYTGVVTVTAEGLPAQTLPIQLTVWDFALPKRSPLRTVFGTNGYRVAEIYGFDRHANESKNNQIIRAYNDFLLDHYLSPESLWDAAPEANSKGLPDFSRQIAGLGTVSENIQHYVQDKQVTAYTYVFADTYPFRDPLGKERLTAQTFIREYAQWCAKYVGAERCYTNPSFVDEPNSAEAYAYAKRWGGFFDEAQKQTTQKIRFQVSEPPLNESPALGDLTGAVDVWIPQFYDLWRDVDYLHKNVVGQRLAAGEEIWAYTSLVSNWDEYKKIKPTVDAKLGGYPPVWQMDFPAINYRIPTWFFHQYGVTGLGYWDTVAWSNGTDVWTDATSFISEHPSGIRFNGDGLLVYPGKQETVGFNAPIASLRLKWIRESIEDYMYWELLKQSGDEAFAQQQRQSFARHLGDWDNKPEQLMQVRQALGERLAKIYQRNQSKQQ